MKQTYILVSVLSHLLSVLTWCCIESRLSSTCTKIFLIMIFSECFVFTKALICLLMAGSMFHVHFSAYCLIYVKLSQKQERKETENT